VTAPGVTKRAQPLIRTISLIPVSFDSPALITELIPSLGVTRYYDFTVSRATLAPDGVQQSMIVVNGQYPGPLIEANWGDWYVLSIGLLDC